jgi:cytochrome c biogenesis protein CcdA
MEEGLIPQLTDWVPFAYAFGAGMVATVNPCGFLMLPSYVAYYLGTEEEGSSPSLLLRGRQGLALSLAITSGFIVLFLAIGLGVSLGGRVLLRIFPLTGLVVGVALFLLGLWLLLGRRWLGIAAASRVVVDFKRSLGGAFIFGLGYGLASLSCTLPVFLVVVGSALSTQGLDRALLQFLAYSLGMGFVLAAVVVSAAFFKGALQRLLQQVLPYVHQVGALFLMGAGVYLIYRGVRFGGLF